MITSFPSHALTTLLVAFTLFSAPAAGGLLEKIFAPKADLWVRWTPHVPNSAARIDHSAWDRWLSTYLVPGADGINRVAYSRVSTQDLAALADYVGYLQEQPIGRFSRAQQLAFWINLYNALTVKTVLEHYPVASIRDIDISPGVFADGPWRLKLVEIEGEPVSLDDIEHRILRPIWRDPRIHYAVNCASLGCPNLQPAAFTAENTQALLEQAARQFVNHPRGARLEGDALVVSSIYSWFRPDFKDDGGVISHLKRYADPSLASRLAGVQRVDRYEYDWRLNEANNVTR